jgi:sulfur carrier protein ThiS
MSDEVFEVKVGRIGETLSEPYGVVSGTTIREVLATAGIDGDSITAKINGITVSLDHKIESDSTVWVVPNLKGGNEDETAEETNENVDE